MFISSGPLMTRPLILSLSVKDWKSRSSTSIQKKTLFRPPLSSPEPLETFTSLRVFPQTLSPLSIRLYRCHRSSESSASISIEPLFMSFINSLNRGPPARDICGLYRILSIPMPSTDLTLRSARMDDLDSIFSIEQSAFPDPYPRGLLKAFFFMPGAYLVATIGGDIVGYAIGIIRYGSVGHIVSIAILKEYRQRGAGKKLLGK